MYLHILSVIFCMKHFKNKYYNPMLRRIAGEEQFASRYSEQMF